MAVSPPPTRNTPVKLNGAGLETNTSAIVQDRQRSNKVELLLGLSKEKCRFIPVNICGVTVGMLLDTGSSVTIMNQSIYEEINTSQRPELKQSDPQLRTVNGEPLDVFGVANVNIVIDGRQYPQQVTVADIARLQGILGLDFVVTHRCVLYMDKSIMRIDGVPVSMRPGDRKSCAHVCASEDVWIEPGEESIVWAYTEKCAMST